MKTITQDDLTALRNVIEYLFADEARSYQEATKEEKEGHIYVSVSHCITLLEKLDKES